MRKIKSGSHVTIYDIAQVLDLSPSTVSRALTNSGLVNQATRRRVEIVANSMGYVSNNYAKNLRQKTSYTVGVIVPRLNSYFTAEVVTHMEIELGSAGYSLVVCQSLESKDKELAQLRKLIIDRVTGLLISVTAETDDLLFANEIMKCDLPVVFFDRSLSFNQFDYVTIDNFKAAMDVTQHLIEQGCKKIAFIGSKGAKAHIKQRREGYLQALKNNGLEVSADLIAETELSMSSGVDVMKQFLANNTIPDAVFAANDNCAIGCMKVCIDAGYRVPDDIAVAGFNDEPIVNWVQPSLTSVVYDGALVGKVAAKTLMNRMLNREMENQGQVIETGYRMIVRDSTCRRN